MGIWYPLHRGEVTQQLSHQSLYLLILLLGVGEQEAASSLIRRLVIRTLETGAQTIANRGGSGTAYYKPQSSQNA